MMLPVLFVKKRNDGIAVLSITTFLIGGIVFGDGRGVVFSIRPPCSRLHFNVGNIKQGDQAQIKIKMVSYALFATFSCVVAKGCL
jgi:hypothetical protein